MTDPSTTTDPRIEAGAKAWDKHMGGRYSPHEVDELSEEVAVILAAADAVDPRKPRTITKFEELDALPEGSVILTPSTNPNYPSLFRKAWRNEWQELDPGDRSDGEASISAEGLLRWDSKDHTATVVFLPRRAEAVK